MKLLFLINESLNSKIIKDLANFHLEIIEANKVYKYEIDNKEIYLTFLKDDYLYNIIYLTLLIKKLKTNFIFYLSLIDKYNLNIKDFDMFLGTKYLLDDKEILASKKLSNLFDLKKCYIISAPIYDASLFNKNPKAIIYDLNAFYLANTTNYLSRYFISLFTKENKTNDFHKIILESIKNL